MGQLLSLQFTAAFLNDLATLSKSDARRVVRALEQLDGDEHNSGLRVHSLKGALTGLSSASASRELRIVFQRLDEGDKVLISVSQHYGD